MAPTKASIAYLYDVRWMPFCVSMVRVLVCVKSDKVGKSLVPNCLGGRKRGI